jgi:hypothetical protein
MDQTDSDFDRIDDEILAYGVSDEALEMAAGTGCVGPQKTIHDPGCCADPRA